MTAVPTTASIVVLSPPPARPRDLLFHRTAGAVTKLAREREKGSGLGGIP